MHGQPTFGRNNIYLHLCCWGIPFISYLIGWAIGAYGVEFAYCGVVSPKIDLFLIFIPMLTTFVVLAITYGTIVYKMTMNLRQIRDRSHSLSESMKNSNERMQRVIRSIGLYPFAYLMQWFLKGILKLELFSVQGNGAFVYLMFMVTCVNSGGCFNCLLYGPLLWNQLHRERRKEMMETASALTSAEEHQTVEVTSVDTDSKSNS